MAQGWFFDHRADVQNKMLCDKDGLISERTYFQFGQQAILKIINNVNILNFSTQSEKVEDIKGQLISKRFLGSSLSSKKQTKTRRILVKTNSFVRFLEFQDEMKM